MGCGSSGNVVPVGEDPSIGQSKPANGVKNMNGRHDNDPDDLPTVVLPETPIKPKPPVAFEIPLEDIVGARRDSTTPPPHLQRLLQPPQPEISLPDIKEKLAEAEQRRMSILQQRAASAQKRSQRILQSLHEMNRVKPDRDNSETSKHGTNAVTIKPEPGLCEDKNIY